MKSRKIFFKWIFLTFKLFKSEIERKRVGFLDLVGVQGVQVVLTLSHGYIDSYTRGCRFLKKT